MFGDFVLLNRIQIETYINLDEDYNSPPKTPRTFDALNYLLKGRDHRLI